MVTIDHQINFQLQCIATTTSTAINKWLLISVRIFNAMISSSLRIIVCKFQVEQQNRNHMRNDTHIDKQEICKGSENTYYWQQHTQLQCNMPGL